MIIIQNILKAYSSAINPLAKYLEPVKLNILENQELPKIKLKSEQLLLKNWWAQAPFQVQKSFTVPIFSFKTSQYTRKTVDLPEQIFNQPLRRDLLHRLYDFRIKLDKFTTKMTRNRGMTTGSRIKMRPQKGQGMARMGDKRAPHLRKGGKVHGSKPKVYSYPLNAKIKLNALKALLSAKLAQGKIRIVDTEEIEEGKTKIVYKAVNKANEDDRTLFCMITHQQLDHKFELAQRNIKRLIWHDTYNLDVLSLFKADKILITVRGLEQLIENIYKTTYVIYRQPHMPTVQEKFAQKQEQEIKWNPQKPYQFKFKILAEYLDQYEKVKKQTPHLLAREIKKIRRVTL